MVRPPPGLVTSTKEVAGRVISTSTKGGASKLIRPGLKFQRPIQPQTRSATTTSATSPSPFNKFLASIYEGVFTSVRSSSAAHPRPGPYSSQRLAPRPSPLGGPRHGFSPSSRPRPSSHRFGPTPRPVLYQVPQTSSLGLGSARKFSSSGFSCFENVVRNAPLALRALADQGLDEKRWKKVTRKIQKLERRDVKGKGAIEGSRFKENVRNEFDQYFKVDSTVVGAPVETTVVEEELLSLYLVLDPEISTFTSSSSPSSTHDFDPSYRILPPSVLSTFETLNEAYTSHSHRLRSIINRLSVAGLLDDPRSIEAGLNVEVGGSGRRIWKIEFKDGFLTRNRLEDIVRGNSVSQGEEGWKSKVENWNDGYRRRSETVGGGGEGLWWIEGGQPSSLIDSNCTSVDLDGLSDPTPSTYLYSPLAESQTSTISRRSSSSFPHSPSTRSTHSFILPDPTSTSSLDLSPPFSPSLEPTSDWNTLLSVDDVLPTLDRFVDESVFEDEMELGEDQDETGSTISWNSLSQFLQHENDNDQLLNKKSDDEDELRSFLGEVEKERERLGSLEWS